MRRAHVVVIGVAGLALAGCKEDKGGDQVLDSVVSATEQVIGAIEDDPDTWLTEAEYGDDVAGTVEGGGGSIEVSGWRVTTEYVPEGEQYLSFSEKLFLEINSFNALGITLAGNIILTRHSLDYGSSGSVKDASRTTHYNGSVVASGSISGNFVIDVHANATGTTLWTCGQINDEETGSGPCY